MFRVAALLQALINLDSEIDIRKHPAATVFQNQGLIAVSPDDAGVVADHDHRAVLARHEQRIIAFLVETMIADGQHFVDQKILEVDRQRHGKCEPHLHAAGIVFHRQEQLPA